MSPQPTPQTVRLTERRGTVARLSAADLAFLLAAHAGHVQVEPTGRRGRYRLTPSRVVGTIRCPDCRLAIRPKIPLANLFALLDPAAPVPIQEDHTAPEAGAQALAFLAGRLAQSLARLSEAGLYRGYAERCSEGPFLQGRLDVAAHTRDPVRPRDRLYCRWEDFTVDVPCNQVAKATAELVLASPLVGERVRGALRAALGGFTEVSDIALGAGSWDDRGLTGAVLAPPQEYRPLLGLCRLLWEGLAPGENAGQTPGPSFLLDLERIFERYCIAGCTDAFRDPRRQGHRFTLSVQPSFRLTADRAGAPDLQLRPDVTADCDGQPLLVLDAKWKRLPPDSVVTDDVYQVLAYGAALGIRRALLIYPGRRDRTWEYFLERAGIRLTLHSLRVVGPREECARSLRGLGRAVLTAAKNAMPESRHS